MTDLQRADKFWQSHLPRRCHILRMELDGNCFFHCISDQSNHDNGAGHDFMRHQHNHISRHDNKFKNFLLLRDDHKDITDLDNYIHNMGQKSTWGGQPEVYAAAWFYDIYITIYNQSIPILVDFLSSKRVDQRALAIPLIQCGISCIMATIISTAFDNPRILHAHLSTRWRLCAKCIRQLPRQFCQACSPVLY
jgi:hypothetical protein